MPAPSTGRDLHVDVPLSNVVVGRRPEGFIADQFIPVTPVDKQSNLYYKFRHGEWRRFENGLTLRAPGTEARKVHMTVTSDSYYVPNYALATDWPVEDEVNADAVLNWASNNALFLTDRLAIDYEYRLAQFAVATTNVRTVTLVGCGWSNASAPIYTQLLDYVEQFRQATGAKPNTMILPTTLVRYVKRNNELRDILFGDRGGVATEQQLAALIGVDRVLVPMSQVNTFGETETENGSGGLADIWGSDSIILSKTSTLAGMMTDTWINAFRWTNPALGVPFAVERYPYDAKKKCYEISVGYYQCEKVVSTDLATRIIVNSQ
jgi:hypothetical protein